MADIAPRWYLKAETPVGTRYFYPVPNSHKPWSTNSHWTDENGTPLVVRGSALVSERRIEQAVERWIEPKRIVGYAMKAVTDVPAHLAPLALSAEYPATLSVQEFGARVEDADDSDTVRGLLDTLYRPVMSNPLEATHQHDLSALTELPGEPNPSPELEWTLTTPAEAAFYGPLVSHLFPGMLTVPFDWVAAQVQTKLDSLHLPGNRLGGGSMYAFNNERKLSVSVSVPWDEPLPYQVMRGTSRRAREINAKRRTEATMAMSWHAEIKIPGHIGGQTKSEAVTHLNELVESVLAALVPPHTTACSHCKGLGFTS